jgi:hypothetical protein
MWDRTKKIGDKFWYFPRHDHTPRQVELLLRLYHGDWVVNDPHVGGARVISERDLHDTFADAKKRLMDWVNPSGGYEYQEIERIKRSIKDDEEELRMIRKIKEPKPGRPKKKKGAKRGSKRK